MSARAGAIGLSSYCPAIQVRPEGRCHAASRLHHITDSVAQDGLTSSAVISIAHVDYLSKSRDQIQGSGYCVASLEAALWSFATTESFEAAILAAANLGDDADTTAAITGQVAGAFYGVDNIPHHWREQLYMSEDIDSMARGLLHRDGRPVPF